MGDFSRIPTARLNRAAEALAGYAMNALHAVGDDAPEWFPQVEARLSEVRAEADDRARRIEEEAARRDALEAEAADLALALRKGWSGRPPRAEDPASLTDKARRYAEVRRELDAMERARLRRLGVRHGD